MEIQRATRARSRWEGGAANSSANHAGGIERGIRGGRLGPQRPTRPGRRPSRATAGRQRASAMSGGPPHFALPPATGDGS
ncbi:hypothetical protein ASE41_12750 [Streptomyces sp. Root264]|nr:hypothetical protein ASE41_12750 [Streptomyces sp. Root264]